MSKIRPHKKPKYSWTARLQGGKVDIYLVLLVAVALISHITWLNPTAVLFHSDWLHWTDSAARQAWDALGTWNSYFGLGGPRIQIGFTLVQDIWSALTAIGLNFDAAVKLTLMLPIAILGFTAPYIALKKLLDDKLVAFLGALFFGSTTYFLLRQGSHLPIAFVYAFSPLIFTAFMNAWETMRVHSWLVFALAYSLGLCYEIRITYIVSFIIFLYAILFWPTRLDKTTLGKRLVLTGILLLGLNSFWILPTLFGGAGGTIAQTTSQDLFGNFLFDLPHAIALSQASWTGGTPDESFVMQPIHLYLWLIPILVLLPLVVRKKMDTKYRQLMIFFAILALIGIFLTKQVLDPLPQAYPWLYAHFPGFSLFREASKFYILTAWGYMGLLALGLIALRKTNGLLFRFAALIPIGVAGVNLLPLITGQMGSLFVARHIPADYTHINNAVARQTDMARTLWVPSDPKWGYFDKTHTRTSAASVIQQDWKPFSPSDGTSTRQQLQAFFARPVANTVADASAIHYIVVPLRDIANEDDFIRYYGDDRGFFTNFLDQVPWLKKVSLGNTQATVYENTHYQSHITSASNLYNLSSLANIDDLYTFNARVLKKDFNFTLRDKKQAEQGQHLSGPLDDPDNITVKDGKLTINYTAKNDKPVLYANGNNTQLSYTTTKGGLSLFSTQTATLKINNQAAETANGKPIQIASAPIDGTHDYYMLADDNIIPINQPEQRNLGTLKNSPRLIATAGDNLIPNDSFEDGAWQSKADDCNNYDQYGDVNMNLNDKEYTDGYKSLELRAIRHTACTGPGNITVTPGSEYLLSFDYRVNGGDEAGYSLSFNDPAHTVITKYPTAKDSSWHTVRQIFTAPKGATTASLKLLGLPNTRNRDATVTGYDNVVLTKVVTALQPIANPAPVYKTYPLKTGNNVLQYGNLPGKGQNLIPNPSLEKSLWRNKVDDCNAYDNNAKLKMRLSDVASNGDASVELQARRHIACTGPGPVAVKENTYYMLRFDHQSPNTSSASYYISFNSPDHSSISADIPTSSKWQTYTRIIKIPAGATTLNLSVRARANEATGKYLTDRYDNFQLVELPSIQNQYFLFDDSTQQFTAPKQTTYTFLDPTKKQVHVKGASTSFYINMSEAYGTKWQLRIAGKNASYIFPASTHIKWDNMTNAWLVDPAVVCKKANHCTKQADGTYDLEMIIEYTPQRLFYMGIFISSFTLIMSLGYLLARHMYTKHFSP